MRNAADRHPGAMSGAGLLSVAGVRGTGAYHRLLVFLDVGQPVDHPAADLEKLWPFAGPAPTLKFAMAFPWRVALPWPRRRDGGHWRAVKP